MAHHSPLAPSAECTQSATASPPDVERRIDEFVRGFRAALLAATDAEVAGLGEQLARQMTNVDARLDAEAGRLWTECALRRYDFERPWTSAAAARRITPRSLLALYDTYIGEGGAERRRLSTHIFARGASGPSQPVVPKLREEYFAQMADRLSTREIRRLDGEGAVEVRNSRPASTV